MKVLVACLLGLACTIGPSAEAETIDSPASKIQGQLPDEVQSVLSRLQGAVDEAVSKKHGQRLAEELRGLRVPEPELWFTQVCGSANGPALSSIYKQSLQKEESRIVEYFVFQGHRGGEVTVKETLESAEPPKSEYHQRFREAIRTSLAQPAKVYNLDYTWQGQNGGSPYSFNFGYLVLFDGAYRLLGERVIRAIPAMPPLRIRQGGAVTERSLISRVPPEYPAQARWNRIGGIVRLHIVIDTHGIVSTVEPVSGHELLIPPAVEAVKQWRYRPILLNGEAVEVDTTVDIIFKLTG